MPRERRELSSSPSKAKKTASPGIRQRQKEWKESLPAPWVKQTNFRHPSGTGTTSKANAKKYRLNDDDLKTLPYEERLSKEGFAMKLYNEDHLMDLAMRKSVKLGVELEIDGVVYHSHSGSSATGSVSVISIKNPPKLPAWMEHITNPQPPPLKLTEYSCPLQATRPDPENIIWRPSKISGPVTVADACRLYCIQPADIEDLAAHSPWIDLASAARRALTLHGGFYEHEDRVRQSRTAEQQALDDEIREPDKRKSRFRFSPMVQQDWDHVDEDAWKYQTMGGSTVEQHRVAVFYPMIYYSDDDYGCDWRWVPDWGDF
ncbi:hypothetical protein C8R47DRAFT_1123587 [Mycena vitilis]|nr:hypothetical protein C8R47DRAFT_1123587 [Mycena vitilis]